MSDKASASGAVSDAVAQIEHELKEFWTTPTPSQAPGPPDASGEPKVRASTLNYVVACGANCLEATREATDRLAETRPGRMFVLGLDNHKEPWSVESEATAICHKDGDSVVCYDRVEIVFGAMSAQRAASVVQSLSLSEVPTIVEIGAGAPRPLADVLATHCDRLIVDSEHTPIARIAELARKADVVVADRAFVRTFSFRDFVARFFDHDPKPASAVSSLRITIAKGGNFYAAALFVGWLASRLGWTIESKTAAKRADGGAIAIRVDEEDRSELTAGEVVAIRMETTSEGKPLSLCVDRERDQRVVSWSMKGAEERTHRFPIGFRDETWVALKAMESTEGDEHYKAAVLAAAEWSAK